MQPKLTAPPNPLIAALSSDPNQRFGWRAFHDSKEGQPAYKPMGTWAAAFPKLLEYSKRGYGIFVIFNETTGQTDNDVTNVRMLAIDLDGSPLQPLLDWCEHNGIQTRIVIRTSANHWHVYFNVTDVPLDKFKRLQKKLAKKFGGDAKCCNLSRVLRVPGFYHQKNPKRPQMVVVQESHPDAEPVPYARWEELLAEVDVPEESVPTSDGSMRTNHPQAKAAVIAVNQPNNVMAAADYVRTFDPSIQRRYYRDEFGLDGETYEPTPWQVPNTGGGDNNAYQLACDVMAKFAISPKLTYELGLKHFLPRCVPGGEKWWKGRVISASKSMQNAPGSEHPANDFIGEELPPLPGDQSPNDKPLSGKKPRIYVSNATAPKNTREYRKHLIDHTKSHGCEPSDMIFALPGNQFCHLSRNKLPRGKEMDADYHVADDLLTVAVSKPWIGDLGERVMDIGFTKEVKDPQTGEIKSIFTRIRTPNWLIERALAIVTRGNFPALRGTVETPTLRADGSILQTPGYDVKSGLYYDPGRTVFPNVPEKPTKADAIAAAKLIEREMLVDYPFYDDPNEPKGLSLSVAMSMELTAVCRRSLRTAPGFIANSNEAQSGKTTLLQSTSMLCTGRVVGQRPWSGDEAELRKALGSALASGDAVLFYDNVREGMPIESPDFANAITGEMFEDRLLGKNDGTQILRPTNVLILISGNHACAKGDMAEGRLLQINLVPDKELHQRTFTHANMVEHVRENRPALVIATLTILRAWWISSVKKKRDAERTKVSGFRHREWNEMVAQALVWLGYVDPCLAEDRVKAHDPQREAQCDLIRAWAEAYGTDPVKASDLLYPIEGPIASAISDLSGMRARSLVPATVTATLKSLLGLTRLGYQVERVKDTGGHGGHGARWRLRLVAGEGIARKPGAESDFAPGASGDGVSGLDEFGI